MYLSSIQQNPSVVPPSQAKNQMIIVQDWLYVQKFVILGTERLFTSEHLIAKIAGSSQLIFCALKETLFSK